MNLSTIVILGGLIQNIVRVKEAFAAGPGPTFWQTWDALHISYLLP